MGGGDSAGIHPGAEAAGLGYLGRPGLAAGVRPGSQQEEGAGRAVIFFHFSFHLICVFADPTPGTAVLGPDF